MLNSTLPSTPGYKFSDWELKGVPLRLEFGPKDAAKDVVSFARRDTGEKGTIPIAELGAQVPVLLEAIQKALYDKADAAFKEHRLVITEWDKVVPALDAKNVVLIPFCEEPACEERIKETTKSEELQEGPDGLKQPSMGMKSLCIPFDQVRNIIGEPPTLGQLLTRRVSQPKGLVEGETKCLNPECSKHAKSWVMFGRSY